MLGPDVLGGRTRQANILIIVLSFFLLLFVVGSAWLSSEGVVLWPRQMGACPSEFVVFIIYPYWRGTQGSERWSNLPKSLSRRLWPGSAVASKWKKESPFDQMGN